MDRRLARGALTNVAGTGAKALYPLFLILATRLYGTEAMGLYLLAVAMLRVVGGVTSSGFRAGVVMIGGRHAGDDGDAARVYQALSTAAWGIALVGGAVVAAVWLGGGGLLRAYNPAQADAGLLPALRTMVWGLPPLMVAELAVAATTAHMVMTYDALIMGLGRPLLLTVCTVAAWFVRPDLSGLALAYVVAHGLLALAGLSAFVRFFSVTRLLGALVRPRLDRELVAVAVPQSLNMSFNYFMSDVDLFMLGMFGASARSLALYSIGAQIIRNVRQIKLAIGGVFAPLAARLHDQGMRAELSERMGVLSRWALLVAVPALLVVWGLRQELLGLFHPELAHLPAERTLFLLPLAVMPLLSCGLGLAANIITMAGLARWNLLNALVGGGVNVALNALLIPPLGLLGAATASAIASALGAALQVVEVRRLLGVPVRLAPLRLPLLAGLAGALPLAAAAALPSTWPVHAALTVAALVTYVAALRAQGLDPRDRAAFRRPKVP